MPLETAAGCREDGWEWECADGGDPGERRGSMDEKEDEKEWAGGSSTIGDILRSVLCSYV